MKSSQIFLSFIFSVCVYFSFRVSAQNCPPCGRVSCPRNNEYCANGIGYDVCGCCPYCLKVAGYYKYSRENDRCGGELKSTHGKCMDGLTCMVPIDAIGRTNSDYGYCIRLRRSLWWTSRLSPSASSWG